MARHTICRVAALDSILNDSLLLPIGVMKPSASDVHVQQQVGGELVVVRSEEVDGRTERHKSLKLASNCADPSSQSILTLYQANGGNRDFCPSFLLTSRTAKTSVEAGSAGRWRVCGGAF